MQDSGRPVLIGYWKGNGEPDLPDPRDFVDASWDACERHELAKYLSNGTVVVEYRTAHIDPRAAALTPPYTAMESYRSKLGRGSTTSTPETAEGAARVRLESAMWDWYSQQQSTSVILEKAYRLRWALEDAMQLSAVTDEEADHYRDILKSAPALGELKFRDTDDERPDGTGRTI